MIEDTGCEILCSVLKHLPNIDSVDLSGCNLTEKGALAVANLIKVCEFSIFKKFLLTKFYILVP